MYYSIHLCRMMFGSLCSMIFQFSTRFENNLDFLSFIENSPSLELKERCGVEKNNNNPFFNPRIVQKRHGHWDYSGPLL